MKNNPRVLDEDCPECGHHHVWDARGYSVQTQYSRKCTKCGWKK